MSRNGPQAGRRSARVPGPRWSGGSQLAPGLSQRTRFKSEGAATAAIGDPAAPGAPPRAPPSVGLQRGLGQVFEPCSKKRKQ